MGATRCLAVLALVAACGVPDAPGDPGGPAGPRSATDAVRESDETGAPPVAPGPPARFVPGPEVRCADPSARADGPYVTWNPGGAWDDQPFDPLTRPLFHGGGVAVADVDGDGVTDVLRTGPGDAFRWYALAEGGAVDRTAELPPIPADTSAVVVVDQDGDGLLDVHVTVWGAPDLLLRQRSDGSFIDVAGEVGLAGPTDELTTSPSWADADGDGDLDVFVATHGPLGGPADPLPPGQPARLLLQADDGTFHDLVPSLPPVHPLVQSHAFLGGWVDLDGDSGPELHVITDFGWRFPNGTWRVRRGALEDVGPLGLESAGEDMGLGLGDLNGDGVDDLVVPRIDAIGLYVSFPGGWYEGAAATGMVPDVPRGQRIGWGAELADLDHDGDLDAVVAFGQLDVSARIPANPARQADAVFVQQDGRFVDRARDWGLAQEGAGRGLVVADLDGDGWLDVVKQDLRGPTTLHRARCGEGAWLVVRLRQAGPNTAAIGARVVVEDGGRRWERTVRAGGTSYASGGPPEVHLGLGDRDRVERVVVRWPDGTVDAAHDVPTRRVLRVER